MEEEIGVEILDRDCCEFNIFLAFRVEVSNVKGASVTKLAVATSMKWS